MTQLSGDNSVPNIVDFNLAKQRFISVDSTRDIYWKLKVPNTGTGVCSGSIVLGAESND